MWPPRSWDFTLSSPESQSSVLDPQIHADVLNQALPYIQQFRGQTFVIKYGGSAMRDPALMEGVIRNVLLLPLVGIRSILVHGGGPEIDTWLTRLGMEKRTLDGQRVTDSDTMEVVEMALARANKQLVAEVQKAGGRAIGLSGRDGDLLIGEAISEDLDRVGRVLQVSHQVLSVICDHGAIPIVYTVATDLEHRPLNVNADLAASAIAAALRAKKLILLTDTDGVLHDKHDPASRISELRVADAQRMIDEGAADRGMIPKLGACISAIQEGVEEVHLINGGTPNALLVEVFTDAGIGTMVTR
jgi:acetylglutamate kinase